MVVAPRLDTAPAPDLSQRNFTAERPNQRCGAYITEFTTDEGKLYPAGVRDLCHRSLVGWAMDEHPDGRPLFLFEWIEVFYNRQRHHAGLGHNHAKDPGSTPATVRVR